MGLELFKRPFPLLYKMFFEVLLYIFHPMYFGFILSQLKSETRDNECSRSVVRFLYAGKRF